MVEQVPQEENRSPAAQKSLPQDPLLTIEPSTRPLLFFNKKIVSVGAPLVGIILALVIPFLTGSTIDKNSGATHENQSNNATNTIMETKTITLKELFPLISGNIADYDITIPKDYVSQHISINDEALGTSVLANNSLTGTRDSIDNVVSQVKENNKVDFKIISHGVFRARFTATTGLDEKGDFVDQKTGTLGASAYEKMGMTNVTYKKETFRGIKSVPVAIITGELQGSHLRMLYLYSPVDNLVVLFSIQGGTDQAENDTIWNAFTESFTKPL